MTIPRAKTDKKILKIGVALFREITIIADFSKLLVKISNKTDAIMLVKNVPLVMVKMFAKFGQPAMSRNLIRR